MNNPLPEDKKQAKPVQTKSVDPKLLKLILVASPVIIIVLLIILSFVLFVSPFAVIGFFFYGLFDLIYKVYRMKVNSNFDLKKLEKK